MEKIIALFEEYILKTIILTENMIAQNIKVDDQFTIETFTDNRQRLLNIIDQISKQIDWANVDPLKCSELNNKIEYINKLDQKLIKKLEDHKKIVTDEIEKTFKQKEKFKGYNLADVK